MARSDAWLFGGTTTTKIKVKRYCLSLHILRIPLIVIVQDALQMRQTALMGGISIIWQDRSLMAAASVKDKPQLLQ